MSGSESKPSGGPETPEVKEVTAVAKTVEQEVPADMDENLKALEAKNALAIREAEAQELVPVKTEEEQALDFLNDLNEEMGTNILNSDIQVSRVQIGQPGVPEIAGTLAGHRAGELLDNVTREVLTIYGKAPWLLAAGVPEGDVESCSYAAFVPVYVLPHEFIHWIKKDEQVPGGDRWKFKTLDATDTRVRDGLWPPEGRWKPAAGEKNSPPVTKNTNVIGYFLDEKTGRAKSGLIVVTFSRTSAQGGRDLITKLQGHRIEKLPPWGYVYYLWTKKETGDSNTWYEIHVSKGRKLSEVDPTNDLYKQCIESAKAFMNKDVSDENLKIVGTNKPMTYGRALQEMYLNAASLAEDGPADLDTSGVMDGEVKGGDTF